MEKTDEIFDKLQKKQLQLLNQLEIPIFFYHNILQPTTIDFTFISYYDYNHSTLTYEEKSKSDYLYPSIHIDITYSDRIQYFRV